MIKLLKHFKKIDVLYIFLIIGLIVFQTWLDMTMPDYTSQLIKLISMGQGEDNILNMSDIWYNGGMMLLCAFGSMAAMVVNGFFIARMASDWSFELRRELITKVTTFSNAEINEFTTPSLITRTTNDVVQVQNFAAMGFQFMIKAPVTAVWAILKLSSTSIEWTQATFAVVVAILVVMISLVLVSLPRFKKIQKLTDDLNDVTRENISGVRVVRAFNAEKFQNNKFEVVNKQVTKNNLFVSRAMGIMQPFMMLSMNGLTVAIYVIGAFLINRETGYIEKATVLGNMGSYTQVAMQVVMSFMFLVMIIFMLPRTTVSANRINEVLKKQPKIKDGLSNKEANVKGSIEFKNVSFSYVDDINHKAIDNVSFKVKPGETIAIIGSTGAGKTSLVNLLNRFYDVIEGEVLINGKNVKDYKLEDLNAVVSLATQKAVLFSGDVKKNITYGDTFDQARFDKAVKLAQASFIYELEGGIEAPVAQGGTNFSGGQKQRLSIARTLYKDADIFVFDDTFSALDYRTDMMVRKGIAEELKDKTIVIVAQRIGTIRQADQIIVLNDGKIAGIGKHEDLLKNNEVYRDIALSQLSEDELVVKEAI